MVQSMHMQNTTLETATFAGGCFWCTEAVFTRVKGVTKVISGYSGGDPPAHSGLSSGSKTGGENPTYQDVSSGATGHAEAIQITFDPSVITYEKLLEIFWHLHDPTTKNRQGADAGTQYRSVIFYHSPKQKMLAEKSKEEMDKKGFYSNAIVTEIIPYLAFYPAENSHQAFYEKNSSYPYCSVVIDPKIQKLLSEFGNEIKTEYKRQ